MRYIIIYTKELDMHTYTYTHTHTLSLSVSLKKWEPPIKREPHNEEVVVINSNSSSNGGGGNGGSRSKKLANLLRGSSVVRLRERGVLERDDRLQVRYAQGPDVWRKGEGQDLLDAVLPALLLLLPSLGAQGPLQLGELVVNNVVGVVDGGAVARVVDVAPEGGLGRSLVWGCHGGLLRVPLLFFLVWESPRCRVVLAYC